MLRHNSGSEEPELSSLYQKKKKKQISNLYNLQVEANRSLCSYMVRKTIINLPYGFCNSHQSSSSAWIDNV
jgi:hypothetical protein